MKKYIYEEWKPVKDYEGLYEVSNFGRVKSLKYGKERILRQYKDNKVYRMVYLCKNGKSKMKRVHRLVAEAFLPNPDNLPQVNHKGENPSKNFVWQLEWCDCYYNNNFGNRNNRISEKSINGKKSKSVLQFDMKFNYIKEYPSLHEVERQLGYSFQSISACCLGKRKTAYGFIWKYKEKGCLN